MKSSGKRALVFGASKGIGLACADALAHEHDVTIVARDPSTLEATRTLLAQRHNRPVHSRVADVGSEGQMDVLLEPHINGTTPWDVVVLNRGGPPPGTLLTLTDAAWRDAFEAQALSTLRTMRLLLPTMRHQRFGRIIIVGSVAARQPIANLDLSNFMRAGLAAIVRTTAREVARDGVTIHMVAPGSILTSRSEERIRARAQSQDVSYDDALAQSAASIPAARLGDPEEVGAVVRFLASPAASYITGLVLPVDGGMVQGIG